MGTTMSPLASTAISTTEKGRKHDASVDGRGRGGGDSAWVIVAVVLGVILCVVLNVVYWRVKSRKLKLAHKRLQENAEAEEGDINVADIAQMFDANEVANINMP